MHKIDYRNRFANRLKNQNRIALVKSSEMEESTEISKNTILETLSHKSATAETQESNEAQLCCIFCENSETFDVNSDNKAILHHLYMEHRLVIADVQDVSDLKAYLDFWKREFKGNSKRISHVSGFH